MGQQKIKDIVVIWFQVWRAGEKIYDYNFVAGTCCATWQARMKLKGYGWLACLEFHLLGNYEVAFVEFLSNFDRCHLIMLTNVLQTPT